MPGVYNVAARGTRRSALLRQRDPGKNRGFKPDGIGHREREPDHDRATLHLVLRRAVGGAHFAGGGDLGRVLSITWPIRPPLATLHCETPPQWLTDPGWKGFGMLLEQSVTIRVAGLRAVRPTNLSENRCRS